MNIEVDVDQLPPPLPPPPPTHPPNHHTHSFLRVDFGCVVASIGHIPTLLHRNLWVGPLRRERGDDGFVAGVY